MSRSDQFHGLTYRAQTWLEKHVLMQTEQKCCKNCGEPYSSKEVMATTPGKFHWSGFSTPDCEYMEIVPKTCLECSVESCGHRLHGYVLKDGRKAYSCVQTSPWSSGPNFFMTIVIEEPDGTITTIPDIDWTDEEINESL